MTDLSPNTQYDPNNNIGFYDQYNAALRSIAQRQLGLQNQLQGGQQNINADFTTGAQNLGDSRDRQIKSLIDNLASNGIARSGINLQGQSDVQNDYLKNYQALTTQRDRSIQDLIQKIQDAHQGLLDQESQLNFQKTAQDRLQGLQDAQVQAAAGVNASQTNLQQPVVTSTGAYVMPNYGGQ